MKTEKVLNRAKWFRRLRPGDVSKANFKDYNALQSISVQLAKYNGSIGRQAGVYLHAKYLTEELSVILVCVTLEQRKKELTEPSCRNDWRKMIPK